VVPNCTQQDIVSFIWAPLLLPSCLYQSLGRAGTLDSEDSALTVVEVVVVFAVAFKEVENDWKFPRWAVVNRGFRRRLSRLPRVRYNSSMRIAPASFVRALFILDPALCTYFNPMKERWTIDRCTRPDSSSGLHKCDFTCRKSHVMFIETPDGQYREPGDDVIGALMAMDMWKHGSAENMTAAVAAKEAEDEAKREAAIADAYDHAGKENKIQLRKAFHLIQQQDTARVH
jgi:hypothetical protein